MTRIKMSPLPFLLAIAFSLILLGCSGGTTKEAESTGTEVLESKESAMELEDTDWMLIELNGEVVEVAQPLKTPSLRFDSGEKLVSGDGGVNRYAGGYTLDDGVLRFGPMRSTMMAGPPEAMDREQAFLKALAGVTDWRIAEGRLELLTDGTVTCGFVEARVTPSRETGPYNP